MNPAITTDIVTAEVAIHAPADRVFDALTDPAQRMKWWSREGRFQVAHMESDLHPGGKWSMSGTAMGGPFQVSGEYRRVDRPRVLSFTWLPTWQGDSTESLVTFDLVEHAGVTTVRLTHSGLVTEASRTSHRGWPQILASLQAYAETR